MNLFKLVGSIFIDTDEANESLHKTDETASKFGEKFGKVAKQVGKGALIVGGAVAAGATAAVDSYADYEQAVGGVETLFADAADKVKANAEQAYKNAGMNATEYMKTVTGFSASLLQGLGGDVNKAADIADMALVDMSDNANKFGSDMQSIQNAYAGFAKGQYSLLDNLKLGYGGTKTEMERLLKDAQEFSGVEYNIDNLADVYEAIHVIQTEMGVAGTTQKEAATTIAGATQMIQAKFSDLVTQVGEAVAPAFQSILGLVIDNMPMIENLINALLPHIVTFIEMLLPQLLDMADVLLPVLFDFLGQILPIISQMAQEILPLIVNLASALLPIIQPILQMLTPLISLLLTLLTPLLDLINLILPPIIELGTAFANLLAETIGKAVETAIKIFNKLKNSVQTIFNQIKEFVRKPINAVIGFINGLIRGIVGGVNGVIRALNRFQIKVPNWITKLTGIQQFGFNLAEVTAPQIPLLASGGDITEEGAAVVGERGAELLQLPKGARVSPLGDGIEGDLKDIKDLLSRFVTAFASMGVYIDSGALVGQIGTQMDKELGRLAVKAGRWA